MTPLHIPISCLPAAVPMWTPGHHRDDHTYGDVTLMPSMRPSHKRACWVVSVRPLEEELVPIERLFVDLSPPPLDDAGNPTRIDALPVMVGMLARAMGHPDGQHTFMPSSTPGAWNLRTFIDGPVRRMSSTFRPDGLGATTTDETYQNFPPAPGLASIDARAPNAQRLALSALFAARVWETA